MSPRVIDLPPKRGRIKKEVFASLARSVLSVFKALKPKSGKSGNEYGYGIVEASHSCCYISKKGSRTVCSDSTVSTMDENYKLRESRTADQVLKVEEISVQVLV